MYKEIILLVIAIGFASPAFAEEVTITMEQGAGMSNCETMGTCYTPMHVIIKQGTDVIFVNQEASPHTATSGSFEEGPDFIMDTVLMYKDDTVTISGELFDKDQRLDYYCMVHPWMTGTIDVVSDFYEAPFKLSPTWFLQVERWHQEGLISDSEYYWAVGHLIELGAITP